MHRYDRTRVMVHCFVERWEVNLPAMVIDQWIGHKFHILQVREEFK